MLHSTEHEILTAHKTLTADFFFFLSNSLMLHSNYRANKILCQDAIICWHSNIYEHDKLHDFELSMKKCLITSGSSLAC